jgi:hypothetical protein
MCTFQMKRALTFTATNLRQINFFDILKRCMSGFYRIVYLELYKRYCFASSHMDACRELCSVSPCTLFSQLCAFFVKFSVILIYFILDVFSKYFKKSYTYYYFRFFAGNSLDSPAVALL